jgi:hypothetical protein
MENNWLPELDVQMKEWKHHLQTNVGLSKDKSDCLASTIANEISSLDEQIKDEINCGTPIPYNIRIDEIIAFQSFMDFSHKYSSKNPGLARAQVITQNYMCFVYLGDSCFKILRRKFDKDTVIGLCCRYLTDNPVRAFRNAISHANWQYASDFKGIKYWAKKGSDPNENMIEWYASDIEINFWQMLARCVAYVIFPRLS